MEEHIRKTQYQINDVSQKKASLEAKGGLSKFFSYSKICKKLSVLEEEQFNSIDNYLIQTDKDYSNTVNDIYDLLATDYIEFNVYTTPVSFFGSHAKALEGTIFPNGYSYTESLNSDFPITAWEIYSFAQSFLGSVNHWGKVQMKKSETSYDFLGKTLPQKLAGHVSSNGTIEIKTIKTKRELTNSYMIGKIIANHFNYDESKNERFQEKRAIINQKLYSYWNQLKKEAK